MAMDQQKEIWQQDCLKHLKEIEFLPLYSKGELAKRWNVSRQAVNNWALRHSDFCKPIKGILEGDAAIYPHYEVVRYEKMRGLNNEH